MKILQLFFLIILSGLLSCNPDKVSVEEDKDGVVTRKPFIWKSSISDGERSYGFYHGYVVDNQLILYVAKRRYTDP